ncbi:MAG: aspartyl protease family protein, partial [Candidatus Acidiferrum sp.]
MKRVLLTIALAGLAGSAHGEMPPPKAAVGKSVTVPFELLKTGHMAVQVKVNGKGPYRLIFDTGAPITLLNNKIAKEAGLLKNVAKPLFTFFGSMGEVKVGSLQVGDQKATDVPAIVMDHPTVEAISRAFGPIDGIVGFPFFARFKMTLDYQAKTLTFIPNGFKPPDVMKAMMTAVMTGAMGGQEGPRVLSPAAQWGMLVAKESDGDKAGISVTSVLPGSPAAKAGMQAGDRLLTLDGRWTDTLADLYTAAGYVKADTTVAVVVKRGDKEI